MRRSKFILGTLVLAVTLSIVVTVSRAMTNSQELAISTLSPEQILAKIEEAKLYKQRQQELKVAINNYFQKAINAGHIVGAGVSIVRGDSLVISEGYGRRNVNEKARVDGETVFRLGSLSKGFASILAADLQSEGKFDWNDKLVDYIPGFEFGSPQNTQKVKISHVLSHTAGTPYHSFTNLVEAGLPMKTIATRFNEVKPISEPGKMYSYQNAMYSLSQEVMQRVTGKDITTLLDDRFFKPLGMKTVTMNHNALLEQDNVAHPHSKNRSGWRKLTLRNRYYNAIAAGGINASSLDMAKWMRFLLGHNPEVMSKDAVAKVFKPFISVNNHRKYYQRWQGHLQSSYGFGWRIHKFQENDDDKEFTVLHHGGSVNNYRNEIALFPEADLGICVLLSNNSRIARTVIPDLHELVNKIYIKPHATPTSVVDLQINDD